MIKTFTPDELTLYVFDEAPTALARQIESAIAEDPELNAQYRQLAVARQATEKISYSPSQKSLDAIFAFSRSYQPH